MLRQTQTLNLKLINLRLVLILHCNLPVLILCFRGVSSLQNFHVRVIRHHMRISVYEVLLRWRLLGDCVLGGLEPIASYDVIGTNHTVAITNIQNIFVVQQVFQIVIVIRNI